MKYMNPVILCADVQKSLPFWTDGLGFSVKDRIENEGTLVWCMLSGFGFYVQLHHRLGTETPPDDYEGIRLYWEPEDLDALHAKLHALGYQPTEMIDRPYGRREFSLIDPDHFDHCFGVEIP